MSSLSNHFKRKFGEVPVSTFLVSLGKGTRNFTKYFTNTTPQMGREMTTELLTANTRRCQDPVKVLTLLRQKPAVPDALSAARSNRSGPQQNQKTCLNQNSFYRGMTFSQYLPVSLAHMELRREMSFPTYSYRQFTCHKIKTSFLSPPQDFCLM